MPMNKPNLATELKNWIQTKYGYEADSQVILQQFCEAVAEAVIEHIKVNATITLTNGNIPVQVNTTTGIGTTQAATLNGKIS
jgi:hypothetical protein